MNGRRARTILSSGFVRARYNVSSSTRAALRSAARARALSFLVPGDVSATGILRCRSHSVEQPPVRHSNCFFFDYFQESTQDSFIYPVILFNIG